MIHILLCCGGSYEQLRFHQKRKSKKIEQLPPKRMQRRELFDFDCQKYTALVHSAMAPMKIFDSQLAS